MTSTHGYRLTVERLRAGRRNIISGFECELPETGIVCVVGPNGAGKSLLIRALTNIDRGQRVSITGDDGTVPEMAVAFDFAGLLPGRGLKDLLVAGEWFDCQAEAMATNLHRLGVDPDNPLPFARWSLGSRQRARIAAALSSTRPIVILDEPFRSIDDEHRFALIELLIDVARNQLVLVSTHHEELLNGFTKATLALGSGPDNISLQPARASDRNVHRVQVTGRGLTRFEGAKLIESDDGVVHQSVALDGGDLAQLAADLTSLDTEIYSIVLSDQDESR